METKFRAKKSLGQNFLKNLGVVEKILSAADLRDDETVIEVGPGMGVLTEGLLAHAKKVIAIEKDTRLIEGLAAKFGDAKNFELINGDALQISPPNEKYKLVANIPYYITSPLLDHFIRENPDNLPVCAVLLVQKEVAEKICAEPSRMNVLALHVQTFGNPKIVSTVSKTNFSPAPKVDSAIIKIDFDGKPKVTCNTEEYFKLIHRAFSQKRKMLRSSFDEDLLKKAGIAPTRRPETLSVSEWERFELVQSGMA